MLANDPFDKKGLPRAKTLIPKVYSKISEYKPKDSYFDHEPKYEEKRLRHEDEAADTNIFDQSLCNDLQRLLNEDSNLNKRSTYA